MLFVFFFICASFAFCLLVSITDTLFPSPFLSLDIITFFWPPLCVSPIEQIIVYVFFFLTLFPQLDLPLGENFNYSRFAIFSLTRTNIEQNLLDDGFISHILSISKAHFFISCRSNNYYLDNCTIFFSRPFCSSHLTRIRCFDDDWR